MRLGSFGVIRRRLSRHGAGLIVLAILLALAGLTAVLSRPTTVTLAVAPLGGTEPALLRAYAAALAARRAGIRLTVRPFDGVRESAEALQAGTVDLAVVRPDVLMPRNGLTLAILREQALFVVAPASAGIGTWSDLKGKRLAILAPRVADQALIEGVVAHYGLTLARDDTDTPDAVHLLPVAEDGLRGAFAERRIDAVLLVTTPTTPTAQRIADLVAAAFEDGRATFLAAGDVPALLAKMPRLQAVTVPAAIFGGAPRQPDEDVTTVGASYRLMARATLSRSVVAEVTQHLFELRAGLSDTVPAANDIAAPGYDDTVAATSARLPIHPGALDYYEREQEGFVERYETWIYLVAFLGGSLGSAAAWLRQRLGRIRRERVEVMTERLLEIQALAHRHPGGIRLRELADEIDALAGDIARQTLERPAAAGTLRAAAIALDAARSTVRRGAEGPGLAANTNLQEASPD